MLAARRGWLVLALAALACARGTPSPPSEPHATTAAQVFSRAVIPRLELVIADDALASLAAKPRKRVPATLIYDGERLEGIGVRLKGHRAMRGLDAKPSWKLAFDHDHDDRRFLGLRGLTLNGLVEDPTRLRETLAYEVFRAAGAPAPRTGFAELVVNGKPYGLYLALESIDEDFLAHTFGDGAGPLYEGEYGCDLHPDDVPGFDQDGGPDDDAALAALAEAAERDPAAMWTLLDRPRVMAFLAASAAVGDFDGYRHAHNYRLYRTPSSGLWALIPWGLDRSLKRKMKIDDSAGVIAKLCFADAACTKAYAEEVQRIAGVIDGLDLAHMADTLATRIDPFTARDPHRPAGQETAEARAKLLEFLRGRAADLRAQTTCVAGGVERDGDGDGAGCRDCDDGDPAIHPGAAEVCGNKRDDDCSGQIDDDPRCGCPVETVDGVAFEICDLPRPWTEAAEFCAARGKALAKIDDRKQSKRLYALAKKRDEGPWWIGLTDRATEGTFAWTDGAPATFTYWKKGQPDDDACHEDCAALKDDADGRWHDTHCGLPRPFVCR